MQSNFSENSDRSSFDGSTNQLERMVDELMPRLHPSWKRILLEDSQSEMTGAEVARTILREHGRTDVKICLSQDERNFYSPLLNWIGLSKDVGGSRSVIAIAIAAHEIGHALEPEFNDKLVSILRKSRFTYLSFWGSAIILSTQLIRFLPELKSTLSLDSQAQNKASSGNYLYQLQQNLKHYRHINQRHLIYLLITLVKWGFNLLLLPITLASLGLGVLFIILLIFCALISRLLIVLIELHVSLCALRLLKKHKILGIHERRVARKFLLVCGLTYLRQNFPMF